MSAPSPAPLLLTLLCGALACASPPPLTAGPRISELLPLADSMGPGEIAVGSCVGGVSERGALLKSCDDLAFLVAPAPAAVPLPAPEYRRERLESALGIGIEGLTVGARYAWEIERKVYATRRIDWRDEARLVPEQIDAIANACRSAARGGEMVVAEYHGCGVVVSSGDVSAAPPEALERVFEARLAASEFETRGLPRGFHLLGANDDRAFEPRRATCDEVGTLLVKTRSLADLCLERVPGILLRAARRNDARWQAALERSERERAALETRIAEREEALRDRETERRALERRQYALEADLLALRSERSRAEGAVERLGGTLDACRADVATNAREREDLRQRSLAAESHLAQRRHDHDAAIAACQAARADLAVALEVARDRVEAARAQPVETREPKLPPTETEATAAPDVAAEPTPPT